VRPRTEQLIRANNLRGLGLVDVLHPDRLSAAALSEWLASNGAPPPLARRRIDFHGLDRLPRFAQDTLAWGGLGARPVVP
jgi:predicted glycosyltransferase